MTKIDTIGHSADRLIEIAAIRSRRHAIDFIREEGRRQGYTLVDLAHATGYSDNWLMAMNRTGAISTQGLLDVLAVLGYRLVVTR